MQVNQTDLYAIINGGKQYVIPLFQRAYSWEKKEWEILWNDIVELYQSDDPNPHFMGSIVTMQTDSLPGNVPKYLLIDGQQRLTTILILLAVLRDRAKKLNQEEIAKEIHETILVNPFKQDFDYYKLLPTQVDRESFFSIINNPQNCTHNTSNNEINKCYSFFERKITECIPDIQKFRNILYSYLILISISLGKDDNPYLVFESLNAKGRDLTQADLIRNYFFMAIAIDQQTEMYEKYWLPMQKLGDNLTEFLRHYLIGKDGKDVKENGVYSVIKKNIDETKKNIPTETIDYLQQISKFAQYYAIFLDPYLEINPQIKKYLIRIKRLNLATIYPFLLNCYHGWQINQFSDQDFIDICIIIENYILRRFVCNIQTTGLNKTFASLYHQVCKKIESNSFDFISQLKLNLQNSNYPLDEDFKENLKKIELYGRNRKEKTKLILESLEESYQHKEQVLFDKLQIEHIMPQTLNDWWKNHLGENYQIIYDSLLHTLGNLTLTAYNPELSNRSFVEKQKEFTKSHLELNQYFEKLDSWNEKDIERRAEKLADKCLKIWEYFGDKSITDSNKKHKITGTKPQSLRILDNIYAVKSWKDVLVETFNYVIDHRAEKLEEITNLSTSVKISDSEISSQSRQLKNDTFIEFSLSASQIDNIFRSIINILELSYDDWEVKIK